MSRATPRSPSRLSLPKIVIRDSLAEELTAWLFIFPVVAGIFIFDVVPMLPSLYISLMQWDGFTPMRFAGLDNYAYLLQDKNFYDSLRNTVEYVITAVPLGIFAGFLLALLVNQKIPGITLFRGMFYLPVISSIVSVAIVFQYILAPQSGLLNSVLYEVFGIVGPRWLVEPGWAMACLVGLHIWTSMGYYMVLFLAGLQGIPVHLYEAATIDGAGALRRVRHVTLPLLTPTFFLVFVMATISAFNVFTTVVVFTGGQAYNGTRVLFVYLWDEALIKFRMGLGSSIAVLMFFGIGALTLLNWRMGDRWVFYG